MTTLQELFSELPYAAVLDDEYLTSRCSQCFSVADKVCPLGCDAIVYCNVACAKNDRAFHQYECDSYRILNKESPEKRRYGGVLVRLIGRVATRLRLDKGAAAVVRGLPKGVKHRTFYDLKKGSRSMRKKLKQSIKWMQPMVEEAYLTFFASTPLGKASKRQVCNLALVVAKNMIRVNQRSFGSQAAISGAAVYLNEPRFGHSCVPDLYVHLVEGSPWRIAICSIKRNSGHQNRPITGRRFDRLTMDRSVALATAQNGFLTLTRARKNALAEGLSIDCRCVKCRDTNLMDLEENASQIECDNCERPYVWIKDTSYAKPSCRCSRSKKCWDGDQERIKVELQLLNIQWGEVMVRISQNSDPDLVILQCQPLLDLAERYWHPLANVRLAQVFHMLFVAYQSKVRMELGPKPGSPRPYEALWAQTAVLMGESMLAIFDHQRCMDRHDAEYGSMCLQIALFCCVSGDRDRMRLWFSKAKTAFEIGRSPKTARTVEDMTLEAISKSRK